MPATGPVGDVGDVGDARMSGVPGGPLASASVELAPDSSAAKVARDWVAAALDGWPVQSVETARLLVSELVTNAVLHAGTEIDLRCSLEEARARFEVADGRGDGPLAKRYSHDSPTGRGLRLVDALSTEWGVTRSPRGKTVWFAVTPDPEGGDGLGTMVGAATVPLGGPVVPEGVVPAAPRPLAAVTVEILGIPLDVYLEAEQHNDAVVRELALLLQTSSARGGHEVPTRLLEIAAEVRAVLGPAATAVRVRVEHALAQCQSTIDLTFDVPVEGWEALVRLAAQLDEVDRFCEAGDLLTLASSPRLRRFRRWYAQQVADQLRGLPATPWREGTGTLPR